MWFNDGPSKPGLKTMWNVLYVDDEEHDVYFMRRAFRRAGMEECLRTVTNGQAAIDYLAGSGQFADRLKFPLPALVLLDLNLPMLSGFEVLKWIRQQPQLQQLPIVIFSSSSRAEDRSLAKQLGASDYLEKPGSGMEFGAVAAALKRKWHDQPVSQPSSKLPPALATT